MNRLATISRRFTSSSDNKKVPQMANIKKGWDLWALHYATHIEKHTLPSQITIEHLLDIQSCKVVLDIACGTGYFGAYRALRKNKNQKFYMVDLSDKMVELSKKRVSLALSLNSLDDSLDKVLATEINEKLLESNNIHVRAQDCSNLEFIETSSVDAYISGLMFHLAPNPEELVKEAARVLRPKAKFSFSVFGNKAKSLYFSMFDDLMTREGVMNFRSKFHLDDEQKIAQMLQNNGFSAIKFIRQELPFSDAFVADVDQHFEMPANKSMLKNLESSKVESLRKEMRQKMQEALQKGHVGVECLIITAERS